MMLSEQKIAIVHDWLNGMRGGEKCMEVFCELFPHADVYTLLYEPGTLTPVIENMPIHTSFIQKLPRSFKYYRHYLPLFPKAIEQFNLNDYDIVLSSSHCAAKGVQHQGHPFHISYVHAPMRYIWGQFDTYFSPQKASPLVRVAAKSVRPYLQQWDRSSSDRVHQFLCNSQNIQQQIQQIYGRSSNVIYPPVDVEYYHPSPSSKSNYYLMVGAFAPNKRVDLAIEAFNELGLPLKIVGSGQEEAKCRSIAGTHIEFLGNQSNEVILELYQGARAFVFPGEDDFGITPVEAQACGTPVIAYARGGALETVTSETGVFFKDASKMALMEAIETLESNLSHYSIEACVSNAQRFSRQRFAQEIQDAVQQGWEQFR